NYEVSALIPTRDQVGHWMESYLPIKDSDGNVKRVGAVVVEITKQKQLEETVRNLGKKLEEERERLRTLLEVNQTLASNLDSQSLLSSITESMRRIVPHDFAGISLYDAERKGMQVWVLSSPQDNKFLTRGEIVPQDQSLAWQAFHQDRVKTFGHEDLVRMNSTFANHVLQAGIRTVHCIPLRTSKGVLGILKVGSTRDHAFSDSDQQLLNQVAAQVAIALDNARAYREIQELKDKLAEEKLYLEHEIRSEFGFEEIIGDSPALKRVLSQAKVVAASEATVLILGETGTGKELIARAIHRMSQRKPNSFIKMNCAAIPTGLLESELFGHEKGAFTGAISQKIGRLELADKGTMFLDEVGDIPLELQPKLLRVLQDQEFERLGSTRTIRVNVRLIAATNRDLARSVADRQFRSDLYYRLRVFPIHMPPLRERRKDIPQLVRYFVQKFARRMNKQIDTIASETMSTLTNWDWPGNIRELENFTERSVILTQGSILRPPLAELIEASEIMAQSATLESAEREHIGRILKETRGVISGANGAAAKLGLKRTTLQSKMQKLGISREQYRGLS
ncbi:MAG TPA: sigma 54-interacting transcriptional regulator, partial [Terriglobales bacterium]|nr:sigma 54-interacting transcriptional regulator [Terriglobales bacterium]